MQVHPSRAKNENMMGEPLIAPAVQPLDHVLLRLKVNRD